MLDLTQSEIRDLVETLDYRLESMMHELVKAEHREFREGLRDTYTRLDALKGRLSLALDETHASL